LLGLGTKEGRYDFIWTDASKFYGWIITLYFGVLKLEESRF